MDTNLSSGANEKVLGFLAEPQTGMEIPILDKPTQTRSPGHAQSSTCAHTPLLAHTRVRSWAFPAKGPSVPGATPPVRPPLSEARFLFSSEEDW